LLTIYDFRLCCGFNLIRWSKYQLPSFTSIPFRSQKSPFPFVSQFQQLCDFKNAFGKDFQASDWCSALWLARTNSIRLSVVSQQLL